MAPGPIAATVSIPGLARELAEALAPELSGDTASTCVVLDLDPVSGIHVAALLSHQRLAHILLLVQRWPYVEAVLPTAELTRALVDAATLLNPDPTAKNLVVVRDAGRSAPIARHPHDPRADNRYTLSLSDHPRLADLRVRGITRVVRIVSG